jgi:hypothetical protein
MNALDDVGSENVKSHTEREIAMLEAMTEPSGAIEPLVERRPYPDTPELPANDMDFASEIV